MKLVSINASNFGSTGSVMLGIGGMAEKEGHTVYVSCANSRSNKVKNITGQMLIGSRLGRNLHLKLAKYTGYNGCFSRTGTFFFLRKLDKIQPDVLHLHNLHNCYINLPMLFRWIKKRDIKVVWTLHDCWAFTGQCPHFQIAGCEKWKKGCFDCPQYREYPKSYVDRTKRMYALKKKWFTGVRDLTIVTPSQWLGELVKQSFLKEYPVKVIYNGIDLNVFHPAQNDLREKLGIGEKTVLLGCASLWNERKGLDVFIELAKHLDDTYTIVLVGLSKEQIAKLPPNIVGMERTANAHELAQYYSMADIFVNPTREEVLGLVNIEALASGTPVITFDTGGSPECIDVGCGIVTKEKHAESLLKSIRTMPPKSKLKSACLSRAKAFDQNSKFMEYVRIYKKHE